MSDRPIQVGDLVATVKCCCSSFIDKGDWLFEVREIWRDDHGGYCKFCKTWQGPSLRATAVEGCMGAPVSWLKRIPPLSELEGQRTEESLRVPQSPRELAYKLDNELTEGLK